MTFTWVRSWTTTTALNVASIKMAIVPRNGILRRVHYGWRCAATTSTLYSAANILDTQIAIGVITGYPDGSYAVPNALTAPDNVAPPLERYLRWEVRWLRPRTWGSHEDDVVTWEDTGPIEATDERAPVTAATPPGDNLGVFLSWAPSRSDFPAAGYVSVSAWWSVLYTT